MFSTDLYAKDSLFTLSPPAILGILAIAGALAVLSALLVWWVSGRGRLAVSMAAAVLVFLAFEWLSPQVFYEYYRLLQPALPAQFLLKRPPDVTVLFETVTFRGPSNLSFHGRGLLFWILLTVALVRTITARRSAAN